MLNPLRGAIHLSHHYSPPPPPPPSVWCRRRARRLCSSPDQSILSVPTLHSSIPIWSQGLQGDGVCIAEAAAAPLYRAASERTGREPSLTCTYPMPNVSYSHLMAPSVSVSAPPPRIAPAPAGRDGDGDGDGPSAGCSEALYSGRDVESSWGCRGAASKPFAYVFSVNVYVHNQQGCIWAMAISM